jgi:hypothetical protein
MSQVIIKNIIIVAGLVIACSGYAAQEPVKVSPRQAHARHVQKIKTKRFGARQEQLAKLEEKGRDQSSLSTLIMNSVHSWSLDNRANRISSEFELSPEADADQAANKVSLHDELLAHFAIQHALDPVQQFADSISVEYNS